MDERARQRRHPSRLELAIWLAGDANDAEDEALPQHVKACRRCSAALAELRQHGDAHELRAREEPALPRGRVSGIAGNGAAWHRIAVGAATVRLVTCSLSLLALGAVAIVVALILAT